MRPCTPRPSFSRHSKTGGVAFTDLLAEGIGSSWLLPLAVRVTIACEGSPLSATVVLLGLGGHTAWLWSPRLTMAFDTVDEGFSEDPDSEPNRELG